MTEKGSPTSQDMPLDQRAAAEFRKVSEAAAWLAAIVENSDDAILSKTLDGVITSWNRGAERLFGYTAAEAIGQPVTLVIPEDRHPGHPLEPVVLPCTPERFEPVEGLDVLEPVGIPPHRPGFAGSSQSGV